MSVDFSTVKAITIPEGNVTKIEHSGTTLWSSSALPAGYTAVNYIANGGSCYTLTQYIPTVSTTMKMECEYEFTATQSGESFLFGYAGSTRVQAEYYAHSAWYICNGIYGARNKLAGVGATLNTKYLLTMDGETATVDGTSTSQNTVYSGSALAIALFAWNQNGTTKYINKGAKIYSLKFTVDGDIEADFVPCLRDQDSEAGFYETVSGTFYPSDSGSYTYG